MKIRFLSAIVACCALTATAAAPRINLTPQPKEITVGSGELALPRSFAIGHAALPADMQAEVGKFIARFGTATGISVTEGASGLFTVAVNPEIAEEGYTLSVTPDGVAIEASTAAGLYYAFTTVMKVMPENVVLGKYAPGDYSLPVMTINDEPRYPWRGMEIDVARHFFTIDQMKKMIDIMAVYKMNRLHWHLTDDQGWRLEMPKYPKLTTEAAAPKNAYWWDFDNHVSFLTNEMYGPLFYTVDEMKELVAYAKERHIEVCPEVDLPGHMQCAIAAYPEFSTTPDGEHQVRYWPGVSTDVLDISNPAVVQFTKDIIDQLVEIFPYEYIHIGGDECPTGAWAASASCQAFKKEYGLKSDRALQNWLVKELADYSRQHDRKLIAWNEIITTDGADKKMAKEADILIYAWLNAGAADNPSKQAAALGLRSVWCSTSHYYLDYPQWSGSSEPKSMGSTITLERVYNAKPDYDAKHKDLYYGVNCNLWTEYVCEPAHLEYNALPRMIAVAETGWTPDSKKDFEDFKARFNADTKMLDLGNYTYGRHYVDAQNDDSKVMPESGKYYRLITQASADANRKDRCIELVHSGCSLIGGKNATVGRLWTNTQVAEGSDHYDWQYWTFEADPAGSGLYAMVNRMAPEGSVSPAMKGSSVDARWDYDNAAKHYEFVVGDYYGDAPLGHTYSIRSNRGSDWYLNCAQAGANLTVNNWSAPDDGNGGIWLFALEGATEAVDAGPAFTALTSGTYAFVNAAGRGLLGIAGGELATEPDRGYGAVAWTVSAGAYDAATNTQPLTLQNAVTGQYLAGLSETAISTTQGIGFQDVYADNGGYDVILTDDASKAAVVTLACSAEGSADFFLSVNGKRLFAFGPNSIIEPNGVNARANAPAKQGATWSIAPVAKHIRVIAQCDGKPVGTFYRFELKGEEPADTHLPAAAPYDDYEIESLTEEQPDGGFTVIYANLKRITDTAIYRCLTTDGVLWEEVMTKVPASGGFTAQAPALPYMTFSSLESTDDPLVFNAYYTTEAYMGIGQVGPAVTEVQEGIVYAIRDVHSTRDAYRCATSGGYVNGAKNGTGLSPMFTWILEANKSKFNVKNVATGTYVQALSRSQPGKLGTKAYGFTFTYDTDHWNIKGANGMYWDGEDDLDMVGWDGGTGHPHQIYTIAKADPFFKIDITEVNADGETIGSRSVFVKAGASYLFAAASHPGMVITGVTGNEGLDAIYSNKQITVSYAADDSGINEIHSDQRPAADGIYDLSGRRLSKVGRPGIYIINGQKTLVR